MKPPESWENVMWAGADHRKHLRIYEIIAGPRRLAARFHMQGRLRVVRHMHRALPPARGTAHISGLAQSELLLQLPPGATHTGTPSP